MDELWLVEDEAALSWVLARALGEAGFRVRHFSRAEEALEALSARVPGLLLTDIRLPGRDGLSLLVEARRQSALAAGDRDERLRGSSGDRSRLRGGGFRGLAQALRSRSRGRARTTRALTSERARRGAAAGR